MPDALEAYKQFIAVASARDAASVECIEQHVRELESAQAGLQISDSRL
jgi:hypothetical protein